MGFLGRIWAIALNTFREAVRMRVLYGIIGLVLLVNVVGLLMTEMNLREQTRMMRDVAVSSISLFGSLIAIFLGVVLLYVEVQRRTIHSIISKPIERWEFVVGKYAGMALVLTVLAAFFIGGMVAMMLLDIGHGAALVRGELGVLSTNVIKATILAYAGILTVAAIAIFFSSFSSPFLSGLFALGMFVVGNLTQDLQAIANKQGGLAGQVIRGILWVIPDLNLFIVSGHQVDGNQISMHASFVDWGYVSHTALYGGLWIAGLLALACVIFQRRDFV